MVRRLLALLFFGVAPVGGAFDMVPEDLLNSTEAQPATTGGLPDPTPMGGVVRGPMPGTTDQGWQEAGPLSFIYTPPTGGHLSKAPPSPIHFGASLSLKDFDSFEFRLCGVQNTLAAGGSTTPRGLDSFQTLGVPFADVAQDPQAVCINPFIDPKTGGPALVHYNDLPHVGTMKTRGVLEKTLGHGVGLSLVGIAGVCLLPVGAATLGAIEAAKWVSALSNNIEVEWASQRMIDSLENALTAPVCLAGWFVGMCGRLGVRRQNQAEALERCVNEHLATVTQDWHFFVENIQLVRSYFGWEFNTQSPLVLPVVESL